jgi:hypothetical protein
MPVPGDFCCVATNGWQAKVIRLVTRSTVNHAFILVAPGRIIEADPGGAVETNLANYDGLYQEWSDMDLSPTVRAKIVDAAHGFTCIKKVDGICVGAPYSWVDDACIGLTRIFGVHVPLWVRNRLGDPKRLECAQLVDMAFADAGVQLFTDHRLPGDVFPGSLTVFTHTPHAITEAMD